MDRRSARAPASTWRVAAAGAAVVGVAFGMARFALGLTLPEVRAELGFSDTLLGVIAGGSFAGFLLGVLLAAPLAAWRGLRAPTVLGGVCAAVGAVLVAVAPSAGPLGLGAVLAGSAAGWVWAPYSDIVGAVAPARERPRLLTAISTGTSGGLVLLGVLAFTVPSWRVVWAGIGAASVAATAVDLRWVPRTVPQGRTGGGRGAWPPVARLLPALVHAVAYFAGTTIYFTYATDAARQGGLGALAGPTLFVVIGVSGLPALATGRLAGRVGPRSVAAGCATAVAGALLLLGAGGGTLGLVVTSAIVFGLGYMAGAAVLAVWTAELVPQRATAAFTAILVVGATTSIVAPVVVGALVGSLGLPVLLVAAAVATVVVGAILPFIVICRRRPTNPTASAPV